jgi:ribosomal protein S18 acetylase RimI-like enzyme
MKKLLLYILISSNFLLLSSAHGREYTKNTCNITYNGRSLATEEEREQCSECRFSRLELYDKDAEKYIAHIAYDSSRCHIEYLRVDEKHRKAGLGSDLVKEAIKDMRAVHNCREISLDSSSRAQGFWKKMGATPQDTYSFTFEDPFIYDKTSPQRYLFNL